MAFTSLNLLLSTIYYTKKKGNIFLIMHTFISTKNCQISLSNDCIDKLKKCLIMGSLP